MATEPKPCPWCGRDHGVKCPEVKAIEYFPSGKVKRVEFKTASDFPQWPSMGTLVVGDRYLQGGRPVVDEAETEYKFGVFV